MRRPQTDTSIVVVFTMRRVVGSNSRKQILSALVEQKSCIIICYRSHKAKNCTFIDRNVVSAVHSNMSEQLCVVLTKIKLINMNI